MVLNRLEEKPRRGLKELVALLALASFASCAAFQPSTLVDYEGYEDVTFQRTVALVIGWREVLGVTVRGPVVVWVDHPRLLVCGTNNDGFYWHGDCKAGIYRHDAFSIRVATRPGRLISDTAFAHELVHAYYDRVLLAEPYKHHGDRFTKLELQIRSALRKRGL